MQADRRFAATYSEGWEDAVVDPVDPVDPADPAAAKPRRPSPDMPAAAAPRVPEPEPSAPPEPASAAVAPAIPGAAAPAPAPLSSPVAIPRPDWLDRVPALFARSAVFQVGRAGDELARTALPCHEAGYSAIFEGPRLGLRDKRVWEVALRAAKAEGRAGAEFALSASDIGKAIGAGCSGRTLKGIGACLNRLKAARVDYATPGGCRGSAALLGSARKASSGWRVSLDPGLVPLLAEDKQFRMDAGRRARLSTDLAQWMHDFMSTHQAGFEIGFNLGKLAGLCGWRGDAGRFPSSLAEALEELKTSCPELVAGFEIKRERRDSRTWRARVDKGPESESFEVAVRKARAKREGPRKGGLRL